MRSPCLILILMCFSGVGVAEDALKKAKEELHAEPPKKEKPSSDTTKSSSSSSVNDVGDTVEAVGDTIQFFGYLVYGIGACFTWPADDLHPAAIMGAEQFPYRDDWHGWYAPVGPGRPGLVWAGEAYAEGGFIDRDLQRYACGGRVMCSALMLRTEWNRFFEARDDDGHDTLTLGTIDVELGITITAKARLGLGLGSTITHDSGGNETGLCGVIGLDLFPIKPVTLHGVFTYATVGGADTEVMTLRGTAGYLWERYELYGGWQATHIGSVNLDGPTAGLRVWF
jgi:hypothetical protein